VNTDRESNRKRAPKLDEALVGAIFTVGAEQSFCNILLEAIDEALSSLGESAKIAMYFHLENTFKIKKREIPDRIDEFQDALEKLLGLGARHLEIMFMKNLYVKIKTVYKMDTPTRVVSELTFGEYVRNVKRTFQEALKTSFN